MKTYEERTQDVLQKVKKKKIRRRRITAVALSSCAVAVAAVNAVLFVPYSTTPPGVEQYADSEYYPIIRQLNELTYRTPAYKNNFEKWSAELFGFFPKGGDMATSPGAPSSWGDFVVGDAPPTAPEEAKGDSPDAESPDSSGSNYEEVTNNQTAGVTEGDRFKRSDKHIFYLDYGGSTGYILRVYAIRGEASEEVASFTVPAEEGISYAGYFDGEIYLSSDCKTVTLISSCYDNDDKTRYAAVASIDVSDLSDIRLKGIQYVAGAYLSSRTAGNDLLLMNNFSVKYNPDFADPANYVPTYGALNDLKPVPMSNIIAPDNAVSAKYTVLYKFDAESMTVTDSYALLSYSNEVYVSANNVYALHGFTEKGTKPIEQIDPAWGNFSDIQSVEGLPDEAEYAQTVTEISCINYAGDGLEYVNSVQVSGSVNDRYSLDERDGVLRVFTSTSYQSMAKLTGKHGGNIALERITSASLTCVDLNTFEAFASVDNFAPQGESVRSARFNGNTAYVCTSVEFTDPVFAFDLSDYNNITYTDTGTITGYSLSLAQFTDGTLLGIGYAENSGVMKIELYREEEGAVTSVASYTENASFSSQFKAYYIDKENGYVGLAVYSYEREKNADSLYQYVLLRYDGYELTEVLRQDFERGGVFPTLTRATMIDGVFYILSGDQFFALTV